jgi:hypothetical protein
MTQAHFDGTRLPLKAHKNRDVQSSGYMVQLAGQWYRLYRAGQFHFIHHQGLNLEVQLTEAK